MSEPEVPNPTVEKPRTARQMLDELRAFFVNADRSETERLWDVLSALRGPDVQDPEVGDTTRIKLGTTAVIRGYVAPGMSMRAHCFVRDGPLKEEALVAMAETCGDHFASHIRAAIDALRVMGYDIKEE